MSILDDLEQVDWQTAIRTYGNDHSTLIGLIVAWWNSRNLDNWTLEGGPSFGYRPKGKGGGICDAILADSSGPAIVLEVEGSRYESTLQKIGNFFEAEYSELETLRAGILLAYAYEPKGRGIQRQFPDVPMEKLVDKGKIIAEEYAKSIAIVAIDKRYDPSAAGIRRRADYYRGAVSSVSAVEIQAGQESGRRVYYP